MTGIELAMQPLRLASGWSSWERIDISSQASEVYETVECLDLSDGIAVVWLEYAIEIVEADARLQKLLQENEAYWQEIRVFNQLGELHLERAGESAGGRFRLDSKAAANGMHPQEYVDSVARLWGRAAHSEADGRICLADEDRKLSLAIPACGQKSEYYGLVTRNYIGENPVTHQAGYVDYRYVAICSADI